MKNIYTYTYLNTSRMTYCLQGDVCIPLLFGFLTESTNFIIRKKIFKASIPTRKLSNKQPNYTTPVTRKRGSKEVQFRRGNSKA